MADSLTPMLCVDSLLRGWAPRRVGRRVIVLGECASTNDSALEIASREPSDGWVVLADHQTAGRGRQGRAWISPRAASILCSVVIEEPLGGRADAASDHDAPPVSFADESARGDAVTRSTRLASPFSLLTSQFPPIRHEPGGGQATSGRLTLVGAVAGCEAIRRATDVHPAIKWPNDLRVNSRKLGGVLIESRVVASRGVRVFVLGIGINCLQHAGHFPPELREHVTSLEIESHGPIDRADVARALLQRLDTWLAENTDQGSREGLNTHSSIHGAHSLHERWLDFAEPLGSRVQLVSAGRAYSGRMLWIDPAGGLVLQCDDGTRTWFDPMQTRMV